MDFFIYLYVSTSAGNMIKVILINKIKIKWEIQGGSFQNKYNYFSFFLP